MIENNAIQRYMDQLAENIAAVYASIEHAAERAHRSPDEITLIAVSKTKPVEMVQAAYQLGMTDFGENRVQEALPKLEAFHPQGLRWHMIGHVQTNKANRVAASFDSVHSVDSLHLAQALERHAASHERRLPILLQVNVAEEASKEGMTQQETPALARQIAQLPHLEIHGLMTIAPIAHDLEEVRPVFRALRELRDQLRDLLPDCSWGQLSMGMTDDYTVAIEEGATMVRIGRAIFGERPKKNNKEL
jgi:hypothetical protein